MNLNSNRMNVPSFIFMIALAGSLLCASAASPQQSDVTLDSVLKKMDATAADFLNVEAALEWDTYQKVIDEIDDVETGRIYYRRNGKEIEMKAEIRMAGGSLKTLKPASKYVLFSGGKLRIYPKVGDQGEYDAGKNRSEFETYLALGFGGSGQDLEKAFDVTFGGAEEIGGVSTARLELVPKSDRVRNTYSKILLWIDLNRGISVQQKFISPDGNYRLCKYSDIKLNEKKFPNDVFKLKTTS